MLINSSKDIYDWDDSVIEEFNNKLIRMASLLHIISKSLPCFEHKLRKDEKKQLVEYLYRLPNMIFMFWAKAIEETYDDLIEELKLNPYLSSEKYKKADNKQLDTKIRDLFSMYSINLLLNLYYIPVVNATGQNTNNYLNNIDFFDFSQTITHKLENLMILEQLNKCDEFAKKSIEMKDEFTDFVSNTMLSLIVRHGIININDERKNNRKNIEKLESKFFSRAQKTLLIERAKNKSLKK